LFDVRIFAMFCSVSCGKTPVYVVAFVLLICWSSAPMAASWFGDPDSGKRVINFQSKKHKPGNIVVSFTDRNLYYVLRNGQAISYPIAIPKKGAGWAGSFRVTDKKVNPDWVPTSRMRAENPKLPQSVPGGHPMNPLGVRALYVGNTLYRIHGTDAPWQIGDAVSRGCVRMFNKDVADLYDRVNVGTKVVVTWNKYNTSPSYASTRGSNRRTASSSREYDRDWVPPGAGDQWANFN
jgi:hypothetical protein